MSERTRTEARQGRREGDMPRTSTSVYDPRKGSEPKQKDDGRHGGQGSVRSRMITKLEATLKRGPRVSGRARKAITQRKSGTKLTTRLLLLQYCFFWSVQSVKHAGLAH